MIQRVQAKDYRCFRTIDVELKPLTVLVGPNDTGKTCFLNAIRHAFSRDGARAFDYWKAQPNNDAMIQLHTAVGKLKRQLSAGFDGSYHALAAKYLPIGFYRLPSDGIPLLCGGLASTRPLPAADDQLYQIIPGMVDYILRKDRKRFDGLEEALRIHIPGFSKINIDTPDAPTRLLELVMEDGWIPPPDLVSTGIRHLIFFLALAYHPQPPHLVLVEEPESGVHPRRLAEIMNLLRDTVKGLRGGYPAQVIVTTHSPYLLDHVKLPEDQVLVFRRNEDGSRSVEPVDEERLSSFLGEFMLGEVWFNRGEEGLVAKAPEIGPGQ